MSFAAIFVPNFVFQSVVRCHPELRMQAVAVIEGTPPICRVVAFNSLAEKLGVRHGMNKANAQGLHQMQIRSRNIRLEENAHRALHDAAWSISSRVEDTAPDTLILDLCGLERLHGTYQEIADRIISRTLELGIEVNVAVSANVETARIVASTVPGITLVPGGWEARFLETLPISALAPSPEVAKVFEQWGVTNCKALASLPVLDLAERVGQEGVRLHAIASGGGNRSFFLTELTDFFEEYIDLEDGIDNLEPLSFLLSRLLQQLCTRVAARSLAISTVHVRFELENCFESSVDSLSEVRHGNPLPKAFSCNLALPVPTKDSSLLLKLLRLRLQSEPPPAPVKKIKAVAEPALFRTTQTNLFVPAVPDPQKLELTMARIAGVVGVENVGSPELLDTHRPDAFRMKKFSVAADAALESSPSVETQTAFRIFRPSLSAWVQLDRRIPKRVAFSGIFGQVLRASGPWRSCGDWWEDQSWQEDAWDVEIEFCENGAVNHGLYRISYESCLDRWRVRGVYD